MRLVPTLRVGTSGPPLCGMGEEVDMWRDGSLPVITERFHY